MPDASNKFLIRSAIGSIAVKVGNAAAVFAVSVILARALGPADFGFYAYVFALISLLTVLAKAGLPELLVREVARHKVDEHWSELCALLRFGRIGNLLTTGLIVVVAACIVWITVGDIDAVRLTTYGWAFAMIPVLVFSELYGGAIRGWGYVVVGQLPIFLLRPAGLVLLLLLCLISGRSLSTASAMGLHFAAAGLALVFGWIWSKRIFSTLPGGDIAGADIRRWVKAALPFTMLAGIMVIDSNIDLLMLGWLASDTDVGTYRAASQTVIVVAFAISSLNMVVAPHIARLYRNGDMHGLQKMVRVGSRLIAVAGLPVAALLVLFGDEFLGLVFGDEFRVAALPLSVLCAGQAVNLLMGINGTVLNMTEYAAVSARIVGAGALLNVILNIWLIPLYGTAGAAIATASSLAFWNVLLSATVYRRLKIRTTAFGL